MRVQVGASVSLCFKAVGVTWVIEANTGTFPFWEVRLSPDTHLLLRQKEKQPQSLSMSVCHLTTSSVMRLIHSLQKADRNNNNNNNKSWHKCQWNKAIKLPWEAEDSNMNTKTETEAALNKWTKSCSEMNRWTARWDHRSMTTIQMVWTPGWYTRRPWASFYCLTVNCLNLPSVIFYFNTDRNKRYRYKNNCVHNIVHHQWQQLNLSNFEILRERGSRPGYTYPSTVESTN